MKELPTIERLREVLSLDEAGVPRWRKTYGRAKAGAEAFTYVTTTAGRSYRVGQALGRSVTRGQIVFALTHDRWPEGEVRRLDGDPMNDAPENLVDALTDPRGRARPRRSPKPSSAFLGVYWDTGHRAWVSRRCINGRGTWLGDFATPEEAARAYDEAGALVENPIFAPIRNFPLEATA